ncbi:MAG: hypothetical protein LIO78_00400 [Clostridiales bacterium]|nr:hypothetical protein [Clostridiales bacterium]
MAQNKRIAGAGGKYESVFSARFLLENAGRMEPVTVHTAARILKRKNENTFKRGLNL